MKICADWLKEFVSIPWDIQNLSERFTMAGFEVESVTKKGPHVILDLNITPNRGDCLSVMGLSREIAAIQGKKWAPKKVKIPSGDGKIASFLQVKVLDAKSAPRYMARIVRGVRIAPSPDWLVSRLESVGLRSINNVVDCTNYVMWELGHPLHAFDLRFLEDGKIVVRKAEAKIDFQTLDGGHYPCGLEDLFICDGKKPVALAGIMGGINSEVRGDTKDIVIEAAYFEPKGVHRTSKRLQLTTESSYRFERGVDPNGVENALHRVVELIVATAGGMPTKDWIDLYPKKIAPLSISFQPAEVKRILGVDFPHSSVKRLFETLGFNVQTSSKKNWKVKIPTFRSDVTSPIDLIEEVARVLGFDQIPSTLPEVRLQAPTFEREEKLKEEIISQLRGFGFSESLHLSFSSLKEVTPFEAKEKIVFLENPLSEDHAILRPSLMPGLLKGLSFNWHRNQKNIKLFELKPVFQWRDGEIFENLNLGLVASGSDWPLQWQLKQKPVDYYSLKGILSQFERELKVTFQFSQESLPSFLVASQSSSVLLEGEKIGWMGLIHPDVAKIWDVDGLVYAMELQWSSIVKASRRTTPSLKEISKYPFVERDLALMVNQNLPAQKIEEAISKFQNPWIQGVQFFDLFRGGNIPADKKSLALNITYASMERTLTNEEVNHAHEALVEYLKEHLNATLR